MPRSDRSTQMTEQLRSMAAAAVPGDTYRSLEIFPEFSGRTFKHILVPLWIMTYTYGAKTYQVLANGYTGKMEGTYPLSPWKVFFAIVLRADRVMIFLTSLGTADSRQGLTSVGPYSGRTECGPSAPGARHPA